MSYLVKLRSRVLGNWHIWCGECVLCCHQEIFIYIYY